VKHVDVSNRTVYFLRVNEAKVNAAGGFCPESGVEDWLSELGPQVVEEGILWPGRDHIGALEAKTDYAVFIYVVQPALGNVCSSGKKLLS